MKICGSSGKRRLKSEYGSSVGWKRISERVRLSVAFAFFRTVYMDVVVFLIESMSAVQNQGEAAPLGNAYPVIFPGDRGKIDNKEQILFLSFISADETENTAVSVIGVDPLKPFGGAVQSGQAGIFPVESQEAADIAL